MYTRYLVMKLERNIESIWKPLRRILIIIAALYALFIILSQVYVTQIRIAQNEAFENGRRYQEQLTESRKLDAILKAKPTKKHGKVRQNNKANAE